MTRQYTTTTVTEYEYDAQGRVTKETTTRTEVTEVGKGEGTDGEA